MNDPGEQVECSSQACSSNHEEYCQHCHKVTSYLNQLRKTGKFCDVVLLVGEETFPAHKALLCSAGGYFSAMFEHDLREKNAREIELPTVCPSIMDGVLDYIYTGEINLGDLTQSQNVLIAADYLNLARLREASMVHMKSFLTTSNFLHTLTFAEQYNFEELSEIVCCFAQSNFTAIVQERKHLEFTVDQLVKVLKSDDLVVEKEEYVFDAIVQWITHHPGKEGSISTLFPHVRLCEIPESTIVDKILRENLILSNENSLNVALAHLKEVMYLKGFCDDQVAANRKPRQVVEAVILLSGSNQPLCYIPSMQGWYLMPSMQWEHKNTPITLCNAKLYVTSGRSGIGLIAQTEYYNPQTNTWSSTGSLPASNYWPGLVSLLGFLYLVGGRTPTSRLKTVWRYDPRINQWDMVSSLREERSGPAVVTCMNHIYAIGGRKNPNEDLSTCERYSPQTNEWKPVASMKTGRSLAAAATIGHRIFVIGGSEDSGMYQLAIPTNEVYDCLLDEWSLIARCQADRVAPGICSLANNIYIFGGRNQQQSLTTVEVYDSTTDMWQVTSNCDKLLNTFSISCCVFYLPKKHLQTFTRLTNNAGQNLDC
jgi:hypothetical protein